MWGPGDTWEHGLHLRLAVATAFQVVLLQTAFVFFSGRNSGKTSHEWNWGFSPRPVLQVLLVCCGSAPPASIRHHRP